MDKQARSADPLRPADYVDGSSGAAGPDAAVGGVQCDLGDLQLFLQRQRAGLAQRAAGDQAVDAVADLEVDVAGRAFGIDALIGVELGGDGREDALPARVAHRELLMLRLRMW